MFRRSLVRRSFDYSDDSYLDEVADLNDRRNRESSKFVRRRRLTEEARKLRELRAADEPPPLPNGADRWTTWGGGEHGPEPYPPWLRTELAAADRELGVLKTGKEADVYLVERFVPDTDRACLLAAKRYRSDNRRLFHRDATYVEGRRMRRSRENRAMANRSSYGRNLLAERWATAEFAALTELWIAGVPVPYPVQRVGTEVLLEFIGGPDGSPAPRLAELRPTGDQLERLWQQLVDALLILAGFGRTHGDLSAYNLLVDTDTDGRERLVLIDLPQVVDVVVNPRGMEFLERDVRNVCEWFRSRGLTDADPEVTLELLASEANIAYP